MLPPALQPLGLWPQFIAWRVETIDGKTTKVPYSPVHAGRASSTNPAEWSSYTAARAFADTHAMAGTGFVFTERDPFFFFDIDHAHDGAQWSPLATQLLGEFAGAAVEVSQSHTGLHVIGSYGAAPAHTSKNKLHGLELYTKERFVALTGLNTCGSADAFMDAPLASLVNRYFNPAHRPTAGADWTREPVAEWAGPEDDAVLLDMAMRSGGKTAAAAFGDDVSFADLWTANSEALAKKWPLPGRAYDASNADQALANHLSYWTGKDCERMERLMRQSALARGKWDSHRTYLSTTIVNACGFMRSVLHITAAPPPPPPAVLEAAGYKPRVNGGVMLYAHQLEHFAGCVYITNLNKILTPGGERLDQARFDVLYGGYSFIVDLDGSKTSNSAWEAFTRNQAFQPPIAHGICFRPEIPPGEMLKTGNRWMANLYTPIETPMTEGDPAPFLNMLTKMLPAQRDREILLTYMAAMKQNPGVKFQWWPVLQGAQGNGKSLIVNALVYSIGEQYSHLPNTEKMVRAGMNFNGWIEGKLLLVLEEIHAGSHRREFLDSLKSTVTNPRLPIEAKGVEEVTGDNRANGFITTNHKDGVPINDGDRRYAVFFSAQQCREDMLRDGMIDPGGTGSSYFFDLYNWAFGRGDYEQYGPDYGFRVINHYLAHLPLVAEFNPAGIATRAPATTSTREALDVSFGRIEQEVREAIEEGVPGFVRPWVSSIKLAKLCERQKLFVSPQKRKEIMQAMGYDWHPALPKGRVDNVVAPDNRKPSLFCMVESVEYKNLERGSVAGAYQSAQQRALNETSKAGKVFGAK